MFRLLISCGVEKKEKRRFDHANLQKFRAMFYEWQRMVNACAGVLISLGGTEPLMAVGAEALLCLDKPVNSGGILR